MANPKKKTTAKAETPAKAKAKTPVKAKTTATPVAEVKPPAKRSRKKVVTPVINSTIVDQHIYRERMLS